MRSTYSHALALFVTTMVLSGCPGSPTSSPPSLVGTWGTDGFVGLTGDRFHGGWNGGGERIGPDVYSSWLHLDLGEDRAFRWVEEVTYTDSAASLASCFEVTTRDGTFVRDDAAGTVVLTDTSATIVRSSCASSADDGTTPASPGERSFAYRTITPIASRYGAGVGFDELYLDEGELHLELGRVDVASEDREIEPREDGTLRISLARTYGSDAFRLAGCVETTVFETTYTAGTELDEFGDRSLSIAEPGPTVRTRAGCAGATDDGSETIAGSLALGGLVHAIRYSVAEDALRIVVDVVDVGGTSYPFEAR